MIPVLYTPAKMSFFLSILLDYINNFMQFDHSNTQSVMNCICICCMYKKVMCDMGGMYMFGLDSRAS